MKRRKIFVTILLIIIFLLISTKVYAAYPTWDSLTPQLKQYIYDLRAFKEAKYGTEAIGKKLTIGNTTLRFEDEIYCMSHKQTLEVATYKVVKYLEIDGNKASIPNSVGPVESNSNIFLGILLSRYENRYGAYEGAPYGSYSMTQKAFWMYFKIWLDTIPNGTTLTNREYFGFDSSYGDGHLNSWDSTVENPNSTEHKIYYDGISTIQTVENELQNAISENTLSKYKTKVRLYFLESTNSNFQKIVIAIPEEPTETELVIDKIDGDTGEYLGGVSFIVQNKDTGEYISTQVVSEGKNVYRATDSSYTTNRSEAMEFVSSKYYTSITIKGLKPGNYLIEEIRNPNEGYEDNVGTQWNVVLKDKTENRFILRNYKIEEPPEEPNGPGEGNVIISGTVWEEEFEGKSNQFNDTRDGGDKGVEGVKVYWKSGNSTLASTVTDSSGYYEMSYKMTIEDHVYRILKSDWKLINDSYVEFEYNGLKYITVANGDEFASNTSKGIEQEKLRTDLDNKFNEVIPGLVKNSDIELSYNSTDAHKSELEQILDNTADYTDFAVRADTKNVVSQMMKKHAVVTKQEEFCVYHCYYDGIPFSVSSYYKDYKGEEDLTKENGKLDEGIDHNADHLMYGNVPHCGHYETDENGNEYYCDSGHKTCKDLTGGNHCVTIYGPATQSLPSEFEIPNINLGLVKKEQPDIALTSDINKVRVIMKGQEYTYYYNGRGLTAPSDELFDYKVKFSGKYTEEYRRPVNPADIAYVDYHGTEDLLVYVTYDIKVKNQSTTLPIEVGEIVNYYDANYTFNSGNWTDTSKYGDTYNSNGYKAMYTQQLAGTILQPGMTSDAIKVEYRVNDNVVKSLISTDEALLKNVSEIYIYKSYYGTDTMCSEHKTASQRGWAGNQYAGIDLDSAPGNAVPGDVNTYEDDTDMAPTFVLCKDPNYKIVSGLVWEDSNEREGSNERVGNGQYDSGENLVEGAQVQLLRINDSGETEPAYLYYIDGSSGNRRLAVTNTDSKGNYTFGEDTVEGVVVDNYVVKYTYGNGEVKYKDADGNEYTETLNTKINDKNGNAITGDEGNPNNIINARNYKSTIITSSPLMEVIKGSGYSIPADQWHLNHTDNYSVAVDDIEERKTIPSLTYENFEDPVNMSAYTAPFKVQVEYSTKSQSSTQKQESGGNINGEEFVGEGEITSGNLTSGTDYENNWTLFDFGIIERAREDIIVDKTIENIKITLANGQVLTEGDPYNQKLSYVKALGDSAIGDGARDVAKNAKAKFLFIEIDSELIQGARLDILYKITVTNNSEKDYEYEYDYSNIEKSSNIVKDNKVYYYYFGEVTTPLIKSTVEWLVDYVDPELTCTVGPNNTAIEDVNGVNDNTYIYQENKDSSGQEKIIWMQVTPEVDDDGNRTKTAAERLFNPDGGLTLDANLDGTNETFISNYQLLSETAKNKIKEQNYSIFITNYFYNVVSGTSSTLNLFASKLLANQAEDYTYENHVEILQLNGKIARNIDSVNDGQQVDKWYKPGDYIPSLERKSNEGVWNENQEGYHEQDDDMITIRITPPTGLESNAIIYISVGAVALIVLALGIYIIKKKVLGK